jgi:hypothetical protein
VASIPNNRPSAGPISIEIGTLFDPRYARFGFCTQRVLAVVEKSFAHIGSFFAATARGIAHTGSYLKNRLVETVQRVCVRVWIVFMTTCPGTPDKLGSLLFTQLANYRKTDNFTRRVVDTFVADCLNKLINAYHHPPDTLLAIFGRPNRGTIDRENSWDKLMELWDKLPILTAFLKDYPLSTLLFLNNIYECVMATDDATIVLKEVLCSDGDVKFAPLQALTKPSDIREWLEQNPDVLAQVEQVSLAHQKLKIFPYEIRLFHNLKTLDCSFSDIRFIHPGVFDKLIHLKELRHLSARPDNSS